jgi:protein phosphatase
MTKLTIRIAGLTDQGKVRANNEDALWTDPELNLMVVADGMGGHLAGEVAAGIAVATIPVNFKQLEDSQTAGEVYDDSFSPETNRLGLCMKIANQMIYEAARRYPQDRGMGTTCTAALIHDDRLSIAHVGDSRCYLIRHGTIEQLTQDHSLVMEQIRHGLVSKDDKAAQANQNILTRSLGPEADVKVDLDEHPLFPDDVVLLCSDGLNKELEDDDVLRLATLYTEPQQFAEQLVKMANRLGGRDNITVVVARVDKVAWSQKFKEPLAKFSRVKRTV